MADDTDSWAAAYDRQKSDAEWGAAYDAQTGGPQHSSTAAGMAHAALRGATFHASDHLMSEETKAKNKRFGKERPIASTVGEGAGFVGSMFVPGVGWASKLPGLRAALPFANFEKAVAGGAKAKTVLHESGKGAAKTGILTRLNDDPEGVQKSGDATTDTLRNVAARGQNAADLGKIATDYGIGAPAGWAGNKIGAAIGSRVADIAQKGQVGRSPQRGATLDIAHEIANDAPKGTTAQDTIKAVRDLVYGEERRLAQHGAGAARGAIPQDAEREMARQFYRLTSDKGLPDAQAERVMARYWGGRTKAAETALTGGSPHPDAWLLANRGNPAGAPSTMGGWAKTAGEHYRSRNEVPSNLTELVAMASGGEAPALQTTLRKLLNLKGEGGNRSQMLRNLRDRQKGIGSQMQNVLRRYLGDGDVATAITQHETNARNANALYPQIFDDLKAMGPEAEKRLGEALRPVIDTALKKAGNKTDVISQALKAEAQKFLDTVEVAGAGSTQPLRSAVTKSIKDEAGNVIGKEQTQVPLTKITTTGQQVTDRLLPGGTTKELRTAGDLESILARRRALKDEVDKAYRGGSKNLGYDLKEFHDSINAALQGLGKTTGDPFQQTMGRWASANDTRAMAGQLERTYKDFLGLNLTAKKGEGLVDLERAFIKYKRMDPANQDMAQRAIMGQFKAMLESKGDLHDAAKIFSNPRTRAILSEMIGPQATEEFGGFVSRAGLATNTFNMNKGSQTASIMDADKQSGLLSSIAGALWHGNPFRAVGHAGEWAADQFRRQKHDRMTGMLMTDTRNPAALEATLQQLQKAATPISARLRRLEEQARQAGTAGGIYVGGRQSGQP